VKTEDAKPVVKVKSEPKDVKLEIKEEPSKPPKPSGKLDFSKAAAKPAPKPAPETRKVKVEPAAAKAAPKSEPKPSKVFLFTCLLVLLRRRPHEVINVWVFQLVEKKSSSLLEFSDSEDETTRAPSAKRTESKSAPRASVKRGVVISDDDNEVEAAPKEPSSSPPPPTKAAYKVKPKAAPPDPDAEKALRAMMDIDDGKEIN